MAHVTRPRLTLPVRNKRAFLERYFSKRAPLGDESGGVFVPGDVDVELGDEVDVQIHFLDEEQRFELRAHVKWKRAGGRRALPPGIGLEFLERDRRTQEHLVAFAEGRDSRPLVNRSQRLGVQVDVRLTGPDGLELTAVTEDVSAGGCFVRTRIPIDTGVAVQVRLRAPGTLFGWLTVPAFVAWSSSDDDRAGIGLEYRLATERERRKVEKIVRVLSERLTRPVTIRMPRTNPTG